MSALSVLSLAALMGMTACGSNSDPDSAASPASTAPSKAVSAAPSPTENAAGSNGFTVVAVDQPSMAYRITGSPHAGLVSITFDNQGDLAHEMTLVKFKPGATLDQLKTALASPNGEQAASAYVENPDQEITGPEIIGPHRSETVTAQLAAGHYVVVCFLPSTSGKSHAQMGMIGEITISDQGSTSTPPANNGTIQLTDTGIDLISTFPSGGTFAVTNAGSKPHDFALAQLQDEPLEDYFRCVTASFSGAGSLAQCSGTLAGGVGTLQPGQTAYLTISLKPGNYGYVSTEGQGADFGAGLHGTFTVG
jgi:uncharacterized cupredoxin-like copper-binding protein